MYGQDSLLPLVKISGAGPGGGDLLLPANVTEDGLGLEAWTPDNLGALTAGKHSITVSLDGQSFSGSDALTSPVSNLALQFLLLTRFICDSRLMQLS